MRAGYSRSCEHGLRTQLTRWMVEAAMPAPTALSPAQPVWPGDFPALQQPAQGFAVPGSAPERCRCPGMQWVSQPRHLPLGTRGWGSVPASWLCREHFWEPVLPTRLLLQAFVRTGTGRSPLPPLQTIDSPRKETAPRSPDRKIPLRAKSSFRSTCKPGQPSTCTKLRAIPNSPP